MLFPQTELFMEFENPTERVYGVRRSVQGFSVWGDWAFVLFHSGICAVYDLITRDPAPIEVFKLASYHDGEPDKRYANHANDLMFGGTLDGAPLMYITAGNSGEADEHGWIAYCAVEALDITRDDAGKPHFSTRLVQSIYYKDEQIVNSPYQTPGWGWPASLCDTERGEYVMLSARYRTTKDFVDRYNDNNYIITRFPLPEIKPGNEVVTLTRADIIGQFEAPYDILATQGGTIHDGKLYYTYGFGKVGYPIGMRVFDLREEKLTARVDFSFTPFGNIEIECCAMYGGRLLVNTQSPKGTTTGDIYALDPAALVE
ncbi:MAG: hypothetical protein IJX53_07435 [Clostridia bacterium]|nr:hypothetical protein [Clostridia bacterium]